MVSCECGGAIGGGDTGKMFGGRTSERAADDAEDADPLLPEKPPRSPTMTRTTAAATRRIIPTTVAPQAF